MQTQDQPPLSTSPPEAVDSAIREIRLRDPDVRAFIEVLEDSARDQATALDRRGDAAGLPLLGLTVAIKEIIDVADALCPWGSQAHADRRATEDADVVKKLRAAGALIMGTVVSTEYAIAAAGPTRNPHDIQRTPGGSSSGPAAAVAAGMVSAALGTQTIGSIVRPALYCGVPGFKPTYGLLPLHGVMPLSTPLDHLGIFAANWPTVAKVFDVLSGMDTSAPYEFKRCIHMAPPSYVSMSTASLNAMEVALGQLDRMGLEIVTLPELDGIREAADQTAYELLAIGMARNHSSDYEASPGLLSSYAKSLIEKGQAYGTEDVAVINNRLNGLRAEIDRILRPGDMVISDAIEDVAPPWASDHTGPNRLQAVWSTLGLPTAAWTTASDPLSGLPIGIQVTSPRMTDTALLGLLKDISRDAL